MACRVPPGTTEGALSLSAIIRGQEKRMTKRMRWRVVCGLVVLGVVCVLGGCVKTAYLPTDARGRYAPSTEIEVLWAAPTRPYTIIGRVSASGGEGKEEKIFRKLKQRAAAAGAQAIIMGGSTQAASVVGVPLATGGTIMVPAMQHTLEALAIRWTTEVSGGGVRFGM
jgi:hypothetical protein